MPRQPMSDPGPPNRMASPASVPRTDEASSENDLHNLVASFAAKSGGTLSLELSADLALEIVLNQIVEQACLATGATGAAVVVKRDGEMICRASSGETAPALGAHMDIESGLSGMCLRSGKVLRCDDTLTDSRTDAATCCLLGIRSMVVLPLLQESEVIGLFQAFSSRPLAFSDRDEQTLEALAKGVVKNLRNARDTRARDNELIPSEPESGDGLVLDVENIEGLDNTLSEASEPDSNLRRNIVTWALATMVFVCAAWLVMMSGQRFGWNKTAEPTHGRTDGSVSRAPVHDSTPAAAGESSKSPASAVAATSKAEPHRVVPSKAPIGSLIVLENGKEVFRMPSSGASRRNANAEALGATPASSVESDPLTPLPATSAEDSVAYRIEPEYPESARELQIQGPVILDVRIGSNGSVKETRVVSGHPLLAEAAIEAVRQWRFKRALVNGKPAEMQTRITLNFRLP